MNIAESYILKIIEILRETDDVELLDFIYQLLQKSI